MNYRERQAPETLAPFVECYWRHDGGVPESGVRRVLPDGCIDLLLVESREQSELLLVGPMTHAELFEASPETHFTGIRFRPAGAAALLGVEARSLQDTVVAVRDLKRAGEWPLPPNHDDEPINQLEVFLLQRLPAIPSAAVGFARFFSNLPADSRDWARLSGYSDRQTRRLFDRWVGLSPRQFRRIARLRRLVATLPEAAGLADAATRAGYCDQSHMNREVRRLTGVTPSRLL